MKIPDPLTYDQIQELLSNPTKENRDILITHNMAYAIKIANKFSNYVQEKDDLYGMAFEALTRATYKYDPSYGVSYYSFIKHEIFYTLQNYTMKENKYLDKIYTPEQIIDDDGNELDSRYLVCDNNQYDEVICSNCIRQILKQYKPDHRSIICMIIAGYNQMFISTYFQVSQGYISKILKKFRYEFRKNYL